MDELALISVIMPVVHAPEIYLRKAIDSVLKQFARDGNCASRRLFHRAARPAASR